MPCLTLRAVQLNPFSCKKSYIVECSANFVTIEAFLTMCAAWCVLLCPVLCIYFYYILYIYAVCATLCASLQLYSFESSFQMQLLLVFVCEMQVCVFLCCFPPCFKPTCWAVEGNLVQCWTPKLLLIPFHSNEWFYHLILCK